MKASLHVACTQTFSWPVSRYSASCWFPVDWQHLIKFAMPFSWTVTLGPVSSEKPLRQITQTSEEYGNAIVACSSRQCTQVRQIVMVIIITTAVVVVTLKYVRRTMSAHKLNLMRHQSIGVWGWKEENGKMKKVKSVETHTQICT